jgi:hypothetical protein
LLSAGKETEGRLDELAATVERLIETASAGRAPEIRQDLERLADARKAMEAGGGDAVMDVK